MTTNTPPEVGTTMKYRDMRAKVVLSSPKYLMAEEGTGRFWAMRHVDDNWRDDDGDVWVVEEPEPPTLTVGTVLKYRSSTRTVTAAAPGFVLVLSDSGQKSSMSWMNNGWRYTSDTYPWEVQL